MQFPVMKAIGATFAFFGANLISILKIVWLAALLLFVANLFVLPPYTEAGMKMQLAAAPGADPAEAAAAINTYFAYTALAIGVSILFNVIMFSGLLRLLIRGENPGLPFYFPIAADELRLAATWVLTLLAFAAIGGIAAIGFVLSQLIGSTGPGPAGFIFNLIIISGVAFGGIYIALRLSLAAPATIDRRKIGIVASWQAAEDNLGGLFGFWLVWTLMILAVSIAVGFVTAPPGYSQAAADAMMTGTDEAMERLNAAIRDMYDLTNVGSVIRLAVAHVFNTFIAIFMCLAGGVAWRYLNGDARTPAAGEPPTA